MRDYGYVCKCKLTVFGCILCFRWIMIFQHNFVLKVAFANPIELWMRVVLNVEYKSCLLAEEYPSIHIRKAITIDFKVHIWWLQCIFWYWFKIPYKHIYGHLFYIMLFFSIFENYHTIPYHTIFSSQPIRINNWLPLINQAIRDSMHLN